MRNTMRLPAPASPSALPGNAAGINVDHEFGTSDPATAIPTRPQLSPRSSRAGANEQTDPRKTVHSRLPREEWEALAKPPMEGWYITKIVLRVFSTCFACCMIPMHYLYGRHLMIKYVNGYNQQIPINAYELQYFFASIIIALNSAEFITMCCRKGRGIPAKAHIFLDLIVFLFGLPTLAYTVYMYIFSGFLMPPYFWVMLPFNSLTCIFHLILCVRSCVDNADLRSTPRIMYLITGEPVIVMPARRAPRPTHEVNTGDFEMNNQSIAAFHSTAQNAQSSLSTDVESAERVTIPSLPPNSAASPSRSLPVLPTLNTEVNRGAAPPWTPSPYITADDTLSAETMVATADGSRDYAPSVAAMPVDQQMSPAPSSSAPLTAVTPVRRGEYDRGTDRDQPRRKPVPQRKGTHYADPWGAPGPEYKPDEAERQRAERGERQAQCMSLGGMGLRGGVPDTKQKPGSTQEPGSHGRVDSDPEAKDLPPSPRCSSLPAAEQWRYDHSQAAEASTIVVNSSNRRTPS